MKEAVFNSVTYVFDNNGYEFTVTGSKMEFDGFLKAYGDYDSSKDVILPSIWGRHRNVRLNWKRWMRPRCGWCMTQKAGKSWGIRP